jgi:hypothetical protein
LVAKEKSIRRRKSQPKKAGASPLNILFFFTARAQMGLVGIIGRDAPFGQRGIAGIGGSQESGVFSANDDLPPLRGSKMLKRKEKRKRSRSRLPSGLFL